jgi:hypothetical protein
MAAGKIPPGGPYPTAIVVHARLPRWRSATTLGDGARSDKSVDHRAQQGRSDMSMMDSGTEQPGGGGARSTSAAGAYVPAQGAGWVLFAGIMMAVVSVLNIIYGIAAIGDSSFFVGDQKYILSNLNTWGWVTLVIGAIQMFAAFSIWNGHAFGRWLGIAMAAVSSIAALLSIPAYPFWSLAIFAVDIMIIYGLAAYGGQRRPV